MKKLFSILLFGVILFSISCKSPSSDLDKLNEKLNSDLKDAMSQMDSIIKMDSITNSVKLADTLYKDSIEIIKCYTEDPNSAGGVNVNVIWKSKSIRTIKYARFDISAYNAVEDEVKGEYNDYFVGKSTGPFNKGKTYGYGTYWENAWYNFSITHAKINSIELEYMDGTIASINIKNK
jgi:hypothetical protein